MRHFFSSNDKIQRIPEMYFIYFRGYTDDTKEYDDTKKSSMFRKLYIFTKYYIRIIRSQILNPHNLFLVYIKSNTKFVLFWYRTKNKKESKIFY